MQTHKTVLITGASQGIGRACALLAAEKGYRVVVNYAQQKQFAEGVVNAILETGGEAIAIQADVSNEQAVIHMMDQIQDTYGYLDALVNNAAILAPQMKVIDMTAERIQSVFSVNVLGSMLCAREAIRRMAVSAGGKGGAIVQVSSISARLGSPFEYVDYAASKGAVETFTIGLAKEMATEGVRVNAVRPGLVYTDIHAKAGEPGRVKRLEPGIPMQRGGQPEEIARTILWLLSEEASYVTGAILEVSGGR
jgi:NAD(P)-dependent dehydrogenase (short-subunit alcohol dehydrogenase family)